MYKCMIFVRLISFNFYFLQKLICCFYVVLLLADDLVAQ
jgi:hypothetical protein